MRNLEASDELLRALSTVLDIRQVFPHISRIAATLVPHDQLTFTFLDRQGDVVVQANSGAWEPLPTRLKLQHLIPEGGGVAIIDDFDEPGHALRSSSRGFWERVQAAGYRSLPRRFTLTAREQLLGLHVLVEAA